MTSFVLRDAAPGDVPELLRLIRALAEYESLTHEAKATEADLTHALFGNAPIVHAIMAEADGKAVGFSLYFFNFSTFTGRPGLYVEDVFVDPAHRGAGLGKALFGELARRALAADCARMEWSVLDWNAAAIGFYRRLGAEAMEQWTTQRLSGDALAALAA